MGTLYGSGSPSRYHSSVVSTFAFFLNSIRGAMIALIISDLKSRLRSPDIETNIVFNALLILKLELGFITKPKKQKNSEHQIILDSLYVEIKKLMEL